MKFNVGDEVYWTDPDSDVSSGIYKITKILNDEVYLIDNGYSETEVFERELT